jgi:hypothetical protein
VFLGLLSKMYFWYAAKCEGEGRRDTNYFKQQNGEQVWNSMSAGAVLYVCGDVVVGMRVRDSIVKIAQVHGQYGSFKAHVCFPPFFTLLSPLTVSLFSNNVCSHGYAI